VCSEIHNDVRPLNHLWLFARSIIYFVRRQHCLWYCKSADDCKIACTIGTTLVTKKKKKIDSTITNSAGKVRRPCSPIHFAGLQSEAASIDSFKRNETGGGVHRHDVRCQTGSNNQTDRKSAGRLLGANLCAPQG
jgi:hypothetical protein